MSTRHDTREVGPGPLCTAYAHLLPLLDLDELEPTEAAAVRGHAADCAWCGRQLREYGQVADELQGWARADEAEPFSLRLETLVTVAGHEHERAGERADALTRPSSRVALDGATRAHHLGSGGKRGRLSALGAMAAVLAVAVLTVGLFAGRGQITRGGRTGHPASAQVVSVATYALPDGAPGRGGPGGPAIVGSDGQLWYVSNLDTIQRISPSGALSSLQLPDVTTEQSNLSVGAGSVWVTDEQNGSVWRIDPSTGSATKYVLYPGPFLLREAVAGPDGFVWFYSEVRGEFGRLDPATGSITKLPVPAGLHGQILHLAEGYGGSVWFSLQASPHNYIGRLDTGNGSIRLFDVSLVTHEDPIYLQPGERIVPAPDGSAWCILASDPKLVRQDSTGTYYSTTERIIHVLPDGTIHSYAEPGDGQEAPGIAVDATSNLWLMYSAQDSVGLARLSPDGVEQDVVTLPRAKVVVADTGAIQAVIEPGHRAWLIRVSRVSGQSPVEKNYAVTITLPAG